MKKNYVFSIVALMLIVTQSFSQITAPFTETFNGSSLPSTWTSSSTTGGPWVVSGTMGWSGSGITDHTGIAGSSRAWIDFSGTDVGVLLTSDSIDVSALGTPELKFYFNSNLGTYSLSPLNFLYPEIWDGTTWVALDTIQQDNQGVWSEHFYNIGAYVTPSNKVVVRFRAESGGSSSDYYLDYAIDDISVIEFSPCRPVKDILSKNITSSGATIEWNTATGADTAWIVEYGVTGFTPGTGTSVQVAADSIVITGLNPSTIYDFYIKGLCNTGDSSMNVGPNSFVTACLSGLSGNYTLNPASATAGTNFNSFNDFFSLLLNCGLSGATTLDVAPGSGPYILSIDMPFISGSSSTNTLTINGNGNTINHGGGSYFIAMDGVKHFTINDFNFVNETPNNQMFGLMMRNGCDSITIKNNTVDLGTGYTSSSSGAIVASNSTTSVFSYGDNANNITIDSNHIIGGYYGVRLNGTNTTTRNYGHKVTNNIVEDFYNSGIYTYYVDSTVIRGNDISRPTRPTLSTFYGIYSYYNNNMEISNNKIHDAGNGSYSAYGMYLGYSSNVIGKETNIFNNAIYNIDATFTFYGIYMYSFSATSKCENMNFWHNTIDMNTSGSSGTKRGISVNTNNTSYFDNIDITNNIINLYGNGTGTKHAIWFPALTTLTGSHNLIRNKSTAGTNNLGYYGADIATLAAWNTASGMTNNTGDNPIIIAPGYAPYSNLIDNLGTPLASVTTDIDGVTRTATPDIGAVEFIPTGGDLSLLNGSLAQVDKCYGTNDTAFISLRNLFGSTVDFSVNPVTIYLNITGPVNTIDSIVLNTDTIAVNQTLDLVYTNVDMSVPGKYSLNAYINFALFNILDVNDTVNVIDASEVKPLIAVNPTFDTIYNFTDSVKISSQSPFYPGGAFFFTEVCHFKTTTGAPLSWPSYLTADDYLEITGVPNSDLGGYTLEQWGTSSLNGSVTFPSGTILNSNGTAIIMLGQSATASQPANFIYDGRGGSTTTYSSSTQAGRILKDPSGNIVDAHGYNGFTFPAAAGVSASDWSSSLSGGGGTSGQRLLGADVNSGTNWVVSSSTNRQDPNSVNPGVTIPAPSSVAGLTWTLINTSTAVDTTPEIVVGPYTANGTYAYEASFITPCGTYKDTAFITVLNQTYDTIVANSCDSVQAAFSGRWFTSTGRYYDTLVATGPVVYDSIFRTYDISIDTTNAEFTFTYCGDYTSPSGKVFTSTGTYYDTIPNSLGCDSLMVFNITTTSEIVLPLTVTACDTYTWRGRTYTASTMDRDTVNNGSCDSIFTLDLTINYQSFDTITTTVCDSLVSPSGKVWNTSGTYQDTIPNAIGCDSVMTFNVTVNYISYRTLSVTRCDTYTSPGGKVFTTSGTYLDTITNALGCDSALTINLTINNSTTQTDVVTLCPGASYRVGPSVYTTAGTYTDVFLTSKGCDSTVNTVLSYYPVATGTATYNFCIGDSVQVLGNWYYSATTFNDTVAGGSSTGCDTITTHIITTRTVTPALNLGNDVISCLDGGVTIFASNAYDSYNWSNGGTTNILNVTGATVGAGSVDYILTVTQASSACTARDTVNITFNDCTGLDEMASDLNVNLFPNPATDFVTIEIMDKLNSGNLTLEILNSIGQVVESKSIENAKEQIIMDVNNFSKGLYLVRVSSDNMYITKKLLIQK